MTQAPDRVGATAGLPVLGVRDLDAALTLYADGLGFAFEWRQGDRIAAIRSGAVDIFLSTEAPAAALILQVEDADALTDQWVAALEVVEPIATRPWGMREFKVRDPDGNLLTVGHQDMSEADFQGFSGPAFDAD